MEFSLKRIFGVTSLALVLTAGAAGAPASAAPFDAGPVVTVKGHVLNPGGKGVKGIEVQSDCGCDFEPGSTPPPTHLLGKDITSSTGFFSFTIRKNYAKNIHFTDPNENYLNVPTDLDFTATSSGYTVDAELSLSSELAGTVRDPNGNPVTQVDLAVYDAKTGKSVSVLFGDVNKAGRFHLKVPAGTYKLKFKGNSYYYTSEWYGGAQLKADATPITVGYDAKVAGLNGTIIAKPYINGKVTLDGKKLLAGTKEKAVVTLLDPNGAVVESRALDGGFSFVDLKNKVGLAPGNYTITATPSDKSYAFFTPVSIPVTVTANQGIENLVVPLASVPPSTTAKASPAITIEYLNKTAPKKGEKFTSKISVKSYGDVSGAKVTIYVGGKKITTRTLNDAGRVNWSTRFTGISAGSHSVYIEYAGTDTTQPRKSFVGSFFVSK
jgi:hypothetical protein